MAIEGFEQRKLAAIMFTDMVGYSALAQREGWRWSCSRNTALSCGPRSSNIKDKR